MILNDIDAGGASHPWPAPITGQQTGSVMVEGSSTYVYARGSILKQQHVSFLVKAWQAIGGQAANTSAAMKYLLKQLEELAGNRDLQPVFIQWTATADPTAALNATELHDGWYVIDSFEPDYTNNVVSGLVKCRMTVSFVAAAPPQTLAMAYAGGALSSNYSGASQLAFGYPFGALNQSANGVSRIGAEGGLPLSVGPSASINPLPFTASATIANWFQGGCRVYDTLVAGGNPVPLGGTFTHASWVQVYGSDHDFAGDIIVTNGLHLYRIQTGQVMTLYLWSTAQATPGWLSPGTVDYLDNTGVSGVARSFTLGIVGLEECRVIARWSNSNGNYAKIALRLQRAMEFSRADFTPLSQANTGSISLRLNLTTPKITYNSSATTDNAVGAASLAVATDYGYAASFTNNTAQPFIAGLLYQNEPSANQPFVQAGYIALGDASGPAQNATRSYGIFAVPFGGVGTTVDKLQAEAESGTLSGGFVSTADAAASAGNTAKLPTGTAAGAVDLFGPSWTPPAGIYRPRWRVRNSGLPTNAQEVNCACYINGVFAAPSLYLGSALGSVAAYTWFNAVATLTLNGTQTFQFRMDSSTLSAASMDWFVDEAVLVPLQLTTADNGPQDLAQQFLHDRTVRMVRP